MKVVYTVTREFSITWNVARLQLQILRREVTKIKLFHAVVFPLIRIYSIFILREGFRDIFYSQPAIYHNIATLCDDDDSAQWCGDDDNDNVRKP